MSANPNKKDKQPDYFIIEQKSLQLLKDMSKDIMLEEIPKYQERGFAGGFF